MLLSCLGPACWHTGLFIRETLPNGLTPVHIPLWAHVLNLSGSYIYYGKALTSERSTHQLYLGSIDYVPGALPLFYPSFIPISKELCVQGTLLGTWGY